MKFETYLSLSILLSIICPAAARFGGRNAQPCRRSCIGHGRSYPSAQQFQPGQRRRGDGFGQRGIYASRYNWLLSRGGNLRLAHGRRRPGQEAGQVLAAWMGRAVCRRRSGRREALNLLTAQQALTSLNENADQARAQAQQTLANSAKALKSAQDERYRKSSKGKPGPRSDSGGHDYRQRRSRKCPGELRLILLNRPEDDRSARPVS